MGQRAGYTGYTGCHRYSDTWVQLSWSERRLMSTRPGQRFPGCLAGRVRLRSPGRCPVPGRAAAAVTVAM